MMRFQAIAANTKIYFGPNIPTLFLQEGKGQPVSHDHIVAAAKKAESAELPTTK